MHTLPYIYSYIYFAAYIRISDVRVSTPVFFLADPQLVNKTVLKSKIKCCTVTLFEYCIYLTSVRLFYGSYGESVGGIAGL